MATSNGALDDAREVGVLLVQAAERAKAHFADAVAPFEISLPAAKALLLLDEPLSMRGLAQQLTCDQSYITNIADELEARALVTRETASDRRVKLLTLTREGASLRSKLSKAVGETSPIALSLNATQRRALRPLLDAVLAGSNDESTSR